jgi:hypothetical protein
MNTLLSISTSIIHPNSESPKKNAHNAKLYKDYLKEITKICKNMEYVCSGFIEPWKGCTTKLELSCNKCGNKWNTSNIDSFIRGMANCKCNRSNNTNIQYTKKYLPKIITTCKDSIYKYLGFVGVWKGVHTILSIHCPIHGEWNTTSYRSFMKGCRCPLCKLDTLRAKFTFSYEMYVPRILDNCILKNCILQGYVEPYNGINTKLKLKCIIDGNIWETTSIAHFIGSKNTCGCSVCVNLNFGKKIKAKYANHWETVYKSEVDDIGLLKGHVILGLAEEYKGVHTKLSIFCNHHKTIHNRTSISSYRCGSSGCLKCIKTGYDDNKDGYIYLMKICSDIGVNFVGYGITNKPKDRMRRHNCNTKKQNYTIIDTIIFKTNGRNALEIELIIKTNYININNISINGFITENASILEYDSIKASIEANLE